MVTYEIQSDIEAVEKNYALYEEPNFDGRVAAIDHIKFNVIDRIEGLLQTANRPEELTPLKLYAERVKRQLENIDNNLFQRLRADIRLGNYTGTALKGLISDDVRHDLNGDQQQDEIGYDNLDVFINGLLLIQPVPIETKAREPEMVYYQPTPARIIYKLGVFRSR
jgi:hypothetical protein